MVRAGGKNVAEARNIVSGRATMESASRSIRRVRERVQKIACILEYAEKLAASIEGMNFPNLSTIFGESSSSNMDCSEAAACSTMEQMKQRQQSVGKAPRSREPNVDDDEEDDDDDDDDDGGDSVEEIMLSPPAAVNAGAPPPMPVRSLPGIVSDEKLKEQRV